MSTPPKSNFAELLTKTVLPRVHLIALAVAAIGLFFHYQQLSGSTDILLIGFSTLAVVYFLSAFSVVAVPPESKHSPYALILFKVLYLSAAVLIIGILFSILKMEGNKEMLLIGCMTLGAGVLFSAALIATNSDNMPILKRPFTIGIPVLLIGVYFLYQQSTQ